MAPPFILEQQLVFQLQGTKTSNVIHWLPDLTVPDGDLIAEFQAIQDAMWIAYRQALHSAVEFLGSVFSAPLVPAFGTRSLAVVGFVGDLSGSAGPTTRFISIRKYAAVDGKTTRGRIYFTGFPEEWSERNVLTDVAVLTVAPLVEALKTPVAAPIASWTPQVFSRKDEASTDVFKTNVDPVVRSLHSRQASGI